MTNFTKRALFWIPRVLTIIFISFLSSFALDVFDGNHGIWQTLLAFIIHQIPVFVLILVLILAWRREWIGAVLYTFVGLLFSTWAMLVPRPYSPVFRLIWISTIAGPLFIIAWLFWINWQRRQSR
ncbi:MAG: hypothetical protein JXA73_07740 [Acidobacteria bacterium]|nr:hypothetical protein [Acidobacteriota bacterium]